MNTIYLNFDKTGDSYLEYYTSYIARIETNLDN